MQVASAEQARVGQRFMRVRLWNARRSVDARRKYFDVAAQGEVGVGAGSQGSQRLTSPSIDAFRHTRLRISVALVPPNPKLLLIAVVTPALSTRSLTKGIPPTSGSGSTALIEGAMKSFSIINRQ